MNKIFTLTLLILTLMLNACGGGSGFLADRAESDETSAITMHMIGEDGEGFEELTRVEIPLAVFGDEDTMNLTGSIGISINDENFLPEGSDGAIASLDASDYYVSDVQLVAFYLPGLADGDTVTFDIAIADFVENDDGSITYSDFVEITYEGAVSASEDSVAVLIVEE